MLGRREVCADCGAGLPDGSIGVWDDSSDRLRCASCALRAGLRSEPRLRVVGSRRGEAPLGEAGRSLVVLHGRAAPNLRQPIDHIAVAPNGVWVIGSLHDRGRVERRVGGRLARRDERLVIGGLDRTDALSGIRRQAAVVRDVLDDADVPVHPALCVVMADWPRRLTRLLVFDGVRVARPERLLALLGASGPIEERRVGSIAARLGSALPRAH